MFGTSEGNTSVTYVKRNTKFVYLHANSPQFDQLVEKNPNIHNSGTNPFVHSLDTPMNCIYYFIGKLYDSFPRFQSPKVQNTLNLFLPVKMFIFHRITAMLK